MQPSNDKIALIESSIPYREAYSVPEIAALLGGASERWAAGQVASGALPSFKAGGKRLVARADLLAYIQRLREDEQRARAAVVTPIRHTFEATA